jgi:hypothetical protein
MYPMVRLVAALAFLILSIGFAQARPRDDAMARAYHCAGQPATRVWLDCYYGAAQPVRAALGMPPAPAAQVQLSDAPPGTAEPADVALRDAAMAGAARCADVSGDRLWLDCYYAASNPVRSALGLPSLAGPPVLARAAPPPAPVSPSGPLPGPQRSTGLFSDIFGPTVIEVRARMVRYSFDSHKNFIVTLENGQTWRQLDGDTRVANWHKAAGIYLVTIKSGAMGSHNLTVKDAPGMFKVKRVS